MARRRPMGTAPPEAQKFQPETFAPDATDMPTLEHKSLHSTAPPMAHMAYSNASAAHLAALTEQITLARARGHFIDHVPMSSIDPHYFIRDRMALGGQEFADLINSLKQHGQHVPFDVVKIHNQTDAQDPSAVDYKCPYGLVSGWRRYQALMEIANEKNQPLDDVDVLVIVRPAVDDGDIYRAMIEENEIRMGLSYFERANLLVQCVERGVFADDRTALQALWGNISKAKRSRIYSFIPIVRHLEPHLRFPLQLSESLGRRLGQRLLKSPSMLAHVQQALADAEISIPQHEHRVINQCLQNNGNRQQQDLLQTAQDTAVADTNDTNSDQETAITADGFAPIAMRIDAASGDIILPAGAKQQGFVEALQKWLAEYPF